MFHYRFRARLLSGLLALLVVLTTVALVPRGVSADAATTAAVVPRPDHVVVVMMENKDRSNIIGSSSAPYINSLAGQGANLSQSYGVTHPSQGNYIALFSGSQQGVTNDDCPKNFLSADNLGSQLIGAGLSFTGYSEDLPSVGYTGCSSADYRRKHNSWVDFGRLPASANQPFSAFPTDFTKLPTVAFVSPNMCNDMHDCSRSTGDSWLKNKIDPYAQWAKTHNSLLVLTFDENEGGTVNQIATILVGESVQPGLSAERTTHYTLLRTIEDAYGLPALGQAAAVAPLSTVWKSTATPTPSASPTPPASETPSASVSPSATELPSPSLSPSTTPTPTPTPTTPAPVNGLINGGFESGLSGWASTGQAQISATERHGGAAAASNGNFAGDSILAQTIVASSSYDLDIWWKGNCRDSSSKAWTTIIIKRNTSGSTSTPLARTCTVSSSWKKVSVSLTRGHSYTIQLISHDDGVASTPNVSYFDDLVVS